jgi:type IV pilus assembly protein PilN
VIRINLIPPEYAAAQRKKEQQILIGSSSGIIAVLLILFWFVQSRRAAELERKINDADAQLRTYQSIIQQIDTIEANKKQLIAKRDVIRNLNRSRLIYPVLFEDLLPILPSDVWISQMNFTEQAPLIRISMSFNATSNFSVATLLSNLQQSTHFSAVDLSPISYATSEATGQLLTFTITSNYQHQGPFPLMDAN